MTIRNKLLILLLGISLTPLVAYFVLICYFCDPVFYVKIAGLESEKKKESSYRKEKDLGPDTYVCKKHEISRSKRDVLIC